jgi:hypothetical protein
LIVISRRNKEKKPYIPPAITKIPPERAKQIIAERIHCSDQEAMDLLESMRHGQQQNNSPGTDNKRKRSA